MIPTEVANLRDELMELGIDEHKAMDIAMRYYDDISRCFRN